LTRSTRYTKILDGGGRPWVLVLFEGVGPWAPVCVAMGICCVAVCNNRATGANASWPLLFTINMDLHKGYQVQTCVRAAHALFGLKASALLGVAAHNPCDTTNQHAATNNYRNPDGSPKFYTLNPDGSKSPNKGGAIAAHDDERFRGTRAQLFPGLEFHPRGAGKGVKRQRDHTHLAPPPPCNRRPRTVQPEPQLEMHGAASAPSSGPSPIVATEPGTSWPCPQCTFANRMDRARCKMCLKGRTGEFAAIADALMAAAPAIAPAAPLATMTRSMAADAPWLAPVLRTGVGGKAANKLTSLKLGLWTW
jgi:hypothetical protein